MSPSGPHRGVWSGDRIGPRDHYIFFSPSLRGPRGRLTPPWCVQMVGSGPLLGQLVAPVSGNSQGARRAEIKPGMREIHLCKDERGKTGLRLRAIDQVGLGAGQERRGHPRTHQPPAQDGAARGPVRGKEGTEQAGEPGRTQPQAQALPLSLHPARP